MDTPIGKEWQTALTHKEAIKPRISVTRGKVIDPIKLTKREEKSNVYGETKAEKRKRKEEGR
jgi:Utp14 protein.